jgi:Retron-type reverse transcriptase
MDKKLEMLASVDLWDRRFPDFIEKKINAEVIVSLADPKFRMKLIQMIEAGNYRFDPPRIQGIPKRNGKLREIYILGDLDRCVMALIADVYTQLYGRWIHPACVSYRSGVGVARILHSVSRKLGTGGFKVDISKYFDSVSREKVNGMLKEMDTGSPIDRILYEFYNTDLVSVDGRLEKRYKSLGQGVALSPLLANLCLNEADKRLYDMCDVYLRYSDDMLILGSHAGNAVDVLRNELAVCGLELNPDKIEKIGENSEFVFLGGRVRKSFVGMPGDRLHKYKLEIRRQIEKAGRRGNRGAQKRAVRAVQQYLLEKHEGYGRIEYFFMLCTTDEDAEILENYVKDQLKAVYAGKQNHTVFSKLTSNKQLEGFGWYSLIGLRHLFCWDRDAYNARVSFILNSSTREGIGAPLPANQVAVEGITSSNFSAGSVKVYGRWINVKREHRDNLMEQAECLWERARRWNGPVPFASMPDEKGTESLSESKANEMAAKQLILLLASSEYEMATVWEKSAKFSDLVIFRDWLAGKPS